MTIRLQYSDVDGIIPAQSLKAGMRWAIALTSLSNETIPQIHSRGSHDRPRE